MHIIVAVMCFAASNLSLDYEYHAVLIGICGVVKTTETEYILTGSLLKRRLLYVYTDIFGIC